MEWLGTMFDYLRMWVNPVQLKNKSWHLKLSNLTANVAPFMDPYHPQLLGA